MSLNLTKLNPNQRAAVLYGEGPLLVLAGAGSGKTSTMAYRIAHLVAERKVAPQSVLGLSFTNKAATELKERVNGLVQKALGRGSARGLIITTFHSLCVRLLREKGELLGFNSDFTIIDENDRRDILKAILRNIRIDDRKFDLDQLLFQIGQAKSRFLSPDQAVEWFLESKSLPSDYAEVLAASYGKYQESLRALNSMDFDDLLFYGVALLDRFPEARTHYNDRFRYILVDEYQDTNPTQFRLLSLLTEMSQNLCVVGDDDQSIYSWRGADAAHILDFSRHFPDASTITLDQNYRSTSTILDAANSVIRNNSKRHAKTLWSDRGTGEPLNEIIVEEDRAEGEFIALEIGKIARSQKRPWKDFAVLYRSNPQSRIFEEALRRNAVPYKIVGSQSFLDRKEVKDVLCYLRLIANPLDDASLRRVINWPSRGIGRQTLETLGKSAFDRESAIFPLLENPEAILPDANAKTLERLRGFSALISGLRSGLEATPVDPEQISAWMRRALEKIQVRQGIREEEEGDPIKEQRRWENVEELIHSLGQSLVGDSATSVRFLQEFLARMVLEAQQAEEQSEKDEKSQKKERDEVTLLTLHGAKGLEYPVVFLVGMEEGLIPHRRTIEEALDFSEERRLAYVGITRARDHLFLTRARNRIRYGKAVPRVRSRFMDEIPKDCLIVRDESFGPDKTDSDEARKNHEEKVKDYLGGIRAMLAAGKSP